MFSRARCVVTVLSVVLLGTSLAVGAPAASANPTDQPAKGLRYGGLQRADATSACSGRFRIRPVAARGGPERCTHGPDTAPDGVDVRVVRRPETPAETTLRPDPVARAETPLCSGDGASGARVQLIYANIAGSPDRFATYAGSFPVWAAAMDSVFSASAAETGGSRRIRFVHDAACAPVVAKVTLSVAAGNDFSTTVDELATKGFNRDDRKYLVWVDTNVYCGIGEVFSDDRAGQNNANNVYGLVARVDNGCWGLVGQSVEAHELMHNMGGVQATAPHATRYNHCTDDSDRMCYADGSGATMSQVCPAAHENVFDCNHDDYFSTAAPAGSYLATHWNAANSAWLVAPTASTAPSAPTILGVAPGDGSVTLAWSAPATTGGSTVTGYVVTPFEGATAKPAQTFPATATTQLVTGLTNDVAQTFKVAAVNAVGAGPQSVASPAVTPASGSRFTAVVPARILDTRSGVGAPAAIVGSGATIDLQVTGRGGVPATGVSAVVLNTTVVDPTSAGYLTAWPSGEARPLASSLNFVTGQTVPNLVVIKVGAGGRISLYNSGAAAHYVADVTGWYGASGAADGSRYHALPPARVLDTRSGDGAVAGKIASGGTLSLQVTGRGGVPATGVSAVVLNVAVTEPAAVGYLTAWPSGDARPLASSLNFTAGQTVANLVTVKVGPDGKVTFYDGGGALHLVADVSGWFGTSGETTGARYHPVTPARVLDTRVGLGALQLPLLNLGVLNLQLAGQGGVPATGVSAVVMNLTVVDPLSLGYLTAWPAGAPQPLASNLNFATRQTVPNLVVAKLGTGGKVSIYNGGGNANLVADVNGWYGPE